MHRPPIKIFLASSAELKSDRKDFKAFIYEKSKSWESRGISLEPIMWEDFIEAMSKTRLQDEYNKAVKEADIFVMLFFTKVGKYTKEEFETAFGHFQETSKLKIYTYFKDADIRTGNITRDIQTMLDFKDRLIELGHFHSTYSNTDNLLFQFNKQLDKLFPYQVERENTKRDWSTRRLTNIPRHDEEIIGREDSVKDLEKLLLSSKKVVLMNGLGGIGKTTMAKLYIQHYEQNYDHIVWIDVKSQDTGSDSDMTIAEAFAYNEVLCKHLGLEFSNEPLIEKFKIIVNALSNISGKNLIIIDNAREDLNDPDTKNIIPGPPNWQVIVTSRLSFNGFQEYEVEHLTEEHALKLFKTYYHKESEEEGIKELLKEISFHTLTIEMLAKTLAFPGQKLSIREVIKRLKNKQLDSEDLQRKIESAHSEKETEIYVHLIQTFNLLPLTDYDKWVMKNFAFLLPRQYVVEEIEILFGSEKPTDQKQLQEGLYTLAKKGWLKYTDEGYGMHRMIQQMVHYQLSPKLKDIEVLIDKLTHFLNFDSSTNFSKIFFLIPYGEHILSQLRNEDITSSKIGPLQNNLGIVTLNSGQHEKARNLLEAALNNSVKNFGESHPSVATLQSNLAYTYKKLGQYAKAKDLLELALKNDLKNFGEQHPNISTLYSILALVHGDLGQHEKARDLLETALNIDLKNFGEQHPAVSIRRFNLASAYNDLQQYEKAKDLLEITLDIDLKTFGEQHPNAAATQSVLATVYKNLGQYEKAKDLQKIALDNDLKNFGEQHPIVAIHQSNLANIYRAMGQYEEAKDLHEVAFGNLLNIFGPQHAEVATCLNNLALVYADMNQLNKAKEHLELAIDILLETVGPDHPNIKNSTRSLEILNQRMNEDNR